MKKSLIMVLMVTALCVVHSYSQVGPATTIQFQLYQNNPDPFDTSGTNIYFELPMATSVSLWIEDTNGNLVASLVSQQAKTAGQYSYHWNAKSQDSTYIIPGIYLCKMSASSFRDSIQMHFEMVTVLSSTALSFGSLASGSTKSLYLKITNIGADSSLVISNITSSNSAFTVSRTSLTIPHNETDSVQVTFTPVAGIIYDDSLTIISNDPQKPTVKVYVTGFSILKIPVSVSVLISVVQFMRV